MAWKPLAERLDDLPLVLAGPILRHTDPKTVTAWVALKDPATVRLDVLDTRGLAPPPPPRPEHRPGLGGAEGPGHGGARRAGDRRSRAPPGVAPDLQQRANLHHQT